VLLTRGEKKQVATAPVGLAARGKAAGRPSRRKEETMEGLVFLVIWLGGTFLHTLFDIKIKPVLETVREEGDFY